MTRPAIGALLISACAVIWQDEYPLPQPGRDLSQEVRVTVCSEGETATGVVVERRLLDGGAPLRDWASIESWGTSNLTPL